MPIERRGLGMSVSTPLIIQRIDEARVKLASRTAFYTINEAADALGVCEATLHAWRNKGLISWTAKRANRHRPPTPCVDPADLRRLIGMSEAAP